jgi:hypothetical protein
MFPEILTIRYLDTVEDHILFPATAQSVPTCQKKSAVDDKEGSNTTDQKADATDDSPPDVVNNDDDDVK